MCVHIQLIILILPKLYSHVLALASVVLRTRAVAGKYNEVEWAASFLEICVLVVDVS